MPFALLSIQMLEGWFEDIKTDAAVRQPAMSMPTDLNGKKPILITDITDNLTYDNLIVAISCNICAFKTSINPKDIQASHSPPSSEAFPGSQGSRAFQHLARKSKACARYKFDKS